jgi:DNA polymerase type B, organellar and viral
MASRKKKPLILGAFDAETNPFDGESFIEPFCFGVAWNCPDTQRILYRDFWGDDCVLDFVGFLESMPPMLLYAHNGGKFDFLFLLDHITEPFLIGSRIVKAKLGQHEIRDSFSIIPQALGAYQKDTIDYAWFTPEKREMHKNDILEYLASDCENLLELVGKFRERFGDKLTIASTAITELEKFHPLEHKGQRHDETFRDYYLGGRVEFFEQGLIEGDFKVYDVNSMYPHAMAEYAHPCGDWFYTRDLDVALAAPVAFIHAKVKRCVGFGVRTKSGLNWGEYSGEMKICTHELISALARDEIELERVYNCMVFPESQNFKTFVDHWMNEKISAEKSGDKAGRMFAKLIANSAYGKTAQNPLNFKEYKIVQENDLVDTEIWEPYDTFGKHEIYRRDNPSSRGFIDVSIGASITSASRSILATALSYSIRPIYCDTDSIICESLSLDLHGSRIGAWKTEAKADRIYIAGKKLYAAFDGDWHVKTASKGARLTPHEIARVALGETILWQSENPTMKFSGQEYLVRNITRRF